MTATSCAPNLQRKQYFTAALKIDALYYYCKERATNFEYIKYKTNSLIVKAKVIIDFHEQRKES